MCLHAFLCVMVSVCQVMSLGEEIADGVTDSTGPGAIEKVRRVSCVCADCGDVWCRARNGMLSKLMLKTSARRLN
jgi:hypothetical protein